MNNSLYEQAKAILDLSIPSSVQMRRTVEPYSPTKCEIEFYVDPNAKLPEKETDLKRYTPNRILKSGNRVIVFWTDGTKTIVKRAEDEPDNDYAAFTAALGIKIFGSNSALRRTIKRKTTVQAKK